MQNKSVRKQLEQIYEKGCMFEKAHCEEQIEKLKKIKTFKCYLTEKRYTSKQINQLKKQMTLHHLKHKSEGGPTSLENGGVINQLAHSYMHSLPREHEEVINNMIREYKLNTAIIQGNGTVKSAQSIKIDMSDCLTIQLLDDNARTKKVPKSRAKLKEELEDFRQEYVDR